MAKPVGTFTTSSMIKSTLPLFAPAPAKGKGKK